MPDDLPCCVTDKNSDNGSITNLDRENNLNQANISIQDETTSADGAVKCAKPETDDEIRKTTSDEFDSRPPEVGASMAAARGARCRRNLAEEIESFRNQGIEFYLQRQYARAKTCFESALKLALMSLKKMTSANVRSTSTPRWYFRSIPLHCQ